MACEREYHNSVRYSILASILFAGLIGVPTIFVSSSAAQINGTPSSVTSPGFGGRAVNGTPPSVTSLGPRGFSPQFRGPVVIPQRTFRNGNERRRNGNEHRRHHDSENFAPLIYAVPVPYAVDSGAVDNGAVDDSDAEDDSNYQGGPTIFDRRGSGAGSYIPGVRDVPPAHQEQMTAQDDSHDTEPAQEPTLLVFQDGRKLEVTNYAIVGATLFDLTPGHTRRVALADLNLEATRKGNDDRGVIFQLPPSALAN